MPDKLYSFVFLLALGFMLLAVWFDVWKLFGYGLGVLTFGRVLLWARQRGPDES